MSIVSHVLILFVCLRVLSCSLFVMFGDGLSFVLQIMSFAIVCHGLVLFVFVCIFVVVHCLPCFVIVCLVYMFVISFVRHVLVSFVFCMFVIFSLFGML